jgi:hypothetical protein
MHESWRKSAFTQVIVKLRACSLAGYPSLVNPEIDEGNEGVVTFSRLINQDALGLPVGLGVSMLSSASSSASLAIIAWRGFSSSQRLYLSVLLTVTTIRALRSSRPPEDPRREEGVAVVADEGLTPIVGVGIACSFGCPPGANIRPAASEAAGATATSPPTPNPVGGVRDRCMSNTSCSPGWKEGFFLFGSTLTYDVLILCEAKSHRRERQEIRVKIMRYPRNCPVIHKI